jgi:hypothetical protein
MNPSIGTTRLEIPQIKPNLKPAVKPKVNKVVNKVVDKVIDDPIHTNILLPFALANAAYSCELFTSYPLRIGYNRTPSLFCNSTLLVTILISCPSFKSVMQITELSRIDPFKALLAITLITLVFLSDVGLNESDRVCVVIFSNIVLIPLVGMTFGKNGLDAWTLANVSLIQPINDKILACYRIATALMLLSGSMILRKSLFLCNDMSIYNRIYLDIIDESTNDNLIGYGCTTCDAKTAFLLAITSGASIAAALLGSIRIDFLKSTLAFAFSSMVQCVAVLCLYITQDQIAAHIPALFENGCYVHEQCPVAYEMRRILSSTHATGSSTFLALSTLVLAGQLIERTMKSKEYKSTRTLFVMILIVATAGISLLIVSSVSELNTFEASIDIALLLTLVGIGIGSIINEFIGAFCITTAIVIDFYFHYIQNVGLTVAITYLTVICNITCLLLYALFVIAYLIKQWLNHQSIRSDDMDRIIECLLLCGRSTSWFLAVGSTSLFGVYDGGALPQREEINNPLVARSAFAFLLWHYAPILVWIMLSRYTLIQKIKRSNQVIIWVVTMIVVGIVYTTALSISTGKLPSEYPISRLASIVVTLLFIVAPCWLCAV